MPVTPARNNYLVGRPTAGQVDRNGRPVASGTAAPASMNFSMAGPTPSYAPVSSATTPHPNTGEQYGPAVPQPSQTDIDAWNQALEKNKLDAELDAYVKQFSDSLSTQRGNIDRDLASALGDVSNRRNMAGAVIGQLPASTQQAYGTVDAAMGNSQQWANSLLPDDNQGAGSAVNAPLRAALSGAGAANAATAPLLQLSATARADSGASALRAAAIEAKGAVDASERDMALSVLGMRRDDKRYADDHAWDREKFAMESGQAALDKQQERLDASGFLGTPQELEQVKQSAPYRYAEKLMNEGMFVNGDDRKKQTPTDIIERYAATNPKLVQALAASNDAMKLAYQQWLGQQYPAAGA